MKSLKIKLFSPGPTPLSTESIKAISAPPIHHRSDDFKMIIKESMELLKNYFDEEHIAVFPSTGSGSLEASVVNFMKSSDSALCLDGGKFGARWADILKAYNIKHHVYKFNWGETPDLEKVEELLMTHKPQALCMQACETSTGTMYDVAAVSALIKKTSPETMLVVDGVTAVGAYKLSMTDSSIDVLIAGSQKALGLPVGLSFLGFSKKAQLAATKSDLPKYYFNALKEEAALKKGTTVFSSPTQVWSALHTELKKNQAKGIENKFEESKKLQELLHSWALDNSIELFSKNPSLSLTALKTPAGMSAGAIQKALNDKGYYIAKGQDEYADKIIRIGHMANISFDEMKTFLSVLKETLKELRAS